MIDSSKGAADGEREAVYISGQSNVVECFFVVVSEAQQLLMTMSEEEKLGVYF